MMERLPRTWKLVFLALGGLAVLVVLASLAALLLVDVDAYKPRVEAAASRTLGMDV
ncbi:secreted protein, partial [sediment metagenome]